MGRLVGRSSDPGAGRAEGPVTRTRPERWLRWSRRPRWWVRDGRWAEKRSVVDARSRSISTEAPRVRFRLNHADRHQGSGLPAKVQSPSRTIYDDQTLLQPYEIRHPRRSAAPLAGRRRSSSLAGFSAPLFRLRPRLEVMEDRDPSLSSFVVSNTDDSGPGIAPPRRSSTPTPAGQPRRSTFDPTAFATPQTITLTPKARLELSDPTGTETITGPAAGLTISGGGQSRVFQVDRRVRASISGMTITGRRRRQRLLRRRPVELWHGQADRRCTITGNVAPKQRRRLGQFCGGRPHCPAA